MGVRVPLFAISSPPSLPANVRKITDRKRDVRENVFRTKNRRFIETLQTEHWAGRAWHLATEVAVLSAVLRRGKTCSHRRAHRGTQRRHRSPLRGAGGVYASGNKLDDEELRDTLPGFLSESFLVTCATRSLRTFSHKLASILPDPRESRFSVGRSPLPGVVAHRLLILQAWLVARPADQPDAREIERLYQELHNASERDRGEVYPTSARRRAGRETILQAPGQNRHGSSRPRIRTFPSGAIREFD